MRDQHKKIPFFLANVSGKSFWHPILSDDGQTLVWLEGGTARTNHNSYTLGLRRLANGMTEYIPLNLSTREYYRLIGANIAQGRVTISHNSKGILVVDRKGRIIWGPYDQPGYSTDFRWVANGWVALDKSGSHCVVWSLGPDGTTKGEKALHRGHKIISVAISPSGDQIAVSSAGYSRNATTNITVLLFRTSDGKTLYRRNYKNSYRNVRLAFLGDMYLAVNRPMAAGNTSRNIDIFRVPSTE